MPRGSMIAHSEISIASKNAVLQHRRGGVVGMLLALLRWGRGFKSKPEYFLSPRCSIRHCQPNIFHHPLVLFYFFLGFSRTQTVFYTVRTCQGNQTGAFG